MLEIKNWSTKNIGQQNLVLENLNSSFNKKELTAIIGLSGSGKTTFINSLALSTKIVNGTIYFDSKEINFLKRKEVKKYRQNIGIISQKTTLIEDLSVYDNLRYVMSEKNNLFFKLTNIIYKNQKEEIFDILKKLDILEKAFYKVRDLSGGEAQRVEIAKLFIRKPKIVLADEPTSNLDQSNSFNIIEMLKELSNKQESVVIVNIHDVNLLQNNIDRVIGIKDKKIFFDKKPDSIDKQDLKDLYGK